MRVLPCRLPSRAALSSRLLSLSAGFVCALALLNAALPPAFGQAPSAPAGVQKTPPPAVAPAAPTAASTTAKTSPAKGAHEGIKVNGFWKIDVRNPDGTLDKHVEFENSFDPFNGSLAAALSAQFTPIGMSVYIGSGNGCLATCSPSIGPQPPTNGVYDQLFTLGSGGPCGPPNGVGTDCILSVPTDPAYNNCLYFASKSIRNYTSFACVPSLSVSLPVYTRSLVLTGNFTVGPQSSAITTVSTIIDVCPTGQAAACIPPSSPTQLGSSLLTGNQTSYFTAAALTPSVTVTTGQIVNVSVTISFH